MISNTNTHLDTVVKWFLKSVLSLSFFVISEVRYFGSFHLFPTQHQIYNLQDCIYIHDEAKIKL